MKTYRILAALFVTIALLWLLRGTLQRFALNMAIRFIGDRITLIDPTTAMARTDAVWLDTRTRGEYAVSHIGGAQWAGYDEFDINKLQGVDTTTPVIVYCSLGARSQDIGVQLKEHGYREVYNLQGGIFFWMEKGLPVVDGSGVPTEKIHPFNWFWGLFATAGEKVYE